MGKAAGRVMGIDFGTRHIGIAVSDELRVIAKGIETVNWNGEDPEWALNRIFWQARLRTLQPCPV